MKRIFYVLASLSALTVGRIDAAPADRPVYVYVYARISDHVNMKVTEDRLRHILPLAQKYRQMYPQAHLTPTILFSGAVSKALQDRNAQTHILDFVKDYIHRGVIEVGYDGTDEPTYEHRPTLEFNENQTPEDRWRLRETVAARFLSEARDGLTGAPTAGTGGLKEMEAVFGPAVSVKGLALALKGVRPPMRAISKADKPGPLSKPNLAVPGIVTEWGGDSETLPALRAFQFKGIVFGVPATNPAQLPGYRDAMMYFGEMMSPVPETAPEIYWQDYVLRISEGARDVQPVKAFNGPEPLQAMLKQVKKSSYQVLQVELGAADAYLKPEFAKTAPNAALQYAYNHPQSPALPEEDLQPIADVNAGWAKEENLLKWFSGEYVTANSGSRAVSSTDLIKMAGASSAYTVLTASLQAEMSKLMQKWQHDTYTPSYLELDGHFLSMAEWFQVMTDALAEFHRTGKLPATVKVAEVHGPIYMPPSHGPNEGEVKIADVAKICAELAVPLHDQSSSEIPKNAIPPVVTVNGTRINSAQFLRLMAQSFVDLTPDKAIPIKMTYMLHELGGIYPKSRTMGDVGFVWTMKPALLQPPPAK